MIKIKTCIHLEQWIQLRTDNLNDAKRTRLCDRCTSAQSTAIALLRLGSIDRKNRAKGGFADIYRIIAPKVASPRCVWSARLDERWERKPSILSQLLRSQDFKLKTPGNLFIMLLSQFFGFVVIGSILQLLRHLL